MIKIEDYILLTKSERQSHLKLNEFCVERGCNSEQCRGLLAHILNTTVPKGHRIQACHACHNEKCNNPFHLYWGTPSENRQDAIACGAVTKNLWQATVEKHGLEKARQLHGRLGEQNPNFGKRWIYNVSEKKTMLVRLTELNSFYELGWKRGNKISLTRGGSVGHTVGS